MKIDRANSYLIELLLKLLKLVLELEISLVRRIGCCCCCCCCCGLGAHHVRIFARRRRRQVAIVGRRCDRHGRRRRHRLIGRMLHDVATVRCSLNILERFRRRLHHFAPLHLALGRLEIRSTHLSTRSLPLLLMLRIGEVHAVDIRFVGGSKVGRRQEWRGRRWRRRRCTLPSTDHCR